MTSLLTLIAMACSGPEQEHAEPADLTPLESSIDSATVSAEDSAAATSSDPTDTATQPAQPGTLLITEVVDHPIDSDIKWVELYNGSDDTVDLATFTLTRYANGSTSGTEALLPSSDLLPGHFFIVANGHAFEAEYGSPADLYDITISGNGNDVYSLGAGATLVDIYGEVGVDGVGTAWEYTDSIATRYFRVTAGTAAWDVSEWTIDDDPANATPWAR